MPGKLGCEHLHRSAERSRWATVTITGQGYGGGAAWVNLSHMVSTGGLNLGAKQLVQAGVSEAGLELITHAAASQGRST